MKSNGPFVRAVSHRTRARVPVTACAERDAAAIPFELGAYARAVDALLADRALSDDEARLRVEQHLTIVHGAPCPELAFDPVANALRATFDRLRARRDERSLDRWTSCVGAFLSGRLEERLASEGASRIALVVALSSIDVCATEDARDRALRRAG